MGAKARKKAAFLERHPLCCFCARQAEEIEHLPSRSCFEDRVWPEGFEFPTCRSCNAGTSQEEQVVALASRMLSAPSAPARLDELEKYISGVANNYREALQEFNNEIAKEGDLHVIEVGEAISSCFARVLPRWAKAFHYKETAIVVPEDATVVTRWFTYRNAVQGDIPPALLEGNAQKVSRNTRDLGEQFGYITRVADDGRSGIYVALFRRSFLAWMGVDLTGQLKARFEQEAAIGANQ